MPARYRLFATDMDGTLFGKDLKVGPRTRAALRTLQERGVVVVLATGRMVAATAPFARELGIEAPIITYQGAWIRDLKSGQDLWHRTIDPTLARELLERLEETGLHINLYRDDQLYLRNWSQAARDYLALARVEGRQVQQWDEVLEQGPTKLVAIGAAEDVVRWERELGQAFAGRLIVTQSQATFLEFVNPEVGKGAALAHLAEKLGIAREAIVAVGDGRNDLDMIRYAGLGVAMGDGHPDLKAAAARVTGTLEQEGVAMLVDALIAEGAI